MIQAAQRIIGRLRRHGHEAFFAGGWVRDHLLNRKSKDIDIATGARPDEVLELFPNSIDIGARFGVVQVRMYGRFYEVATFRSDAAYYDGRHPSSVSFSGPRQDALRRDFTINGLFYDPETQRVIDYVRGRYDIRKKLIRAIGDPRARFGEDRLRMLRAIRFACNLGFKITPETWGAIVDLAPQIPQVSRERIRDELTGILTGPAPGTGIKMMHASGLLSHILPEIENLQKKKFRSGSKENALGHTIASLDLLRHPSAVLAFGTLLHELAGAAPRTVVRTGRTGGDKQCSAATVEKVCRRLRFSRKESDRISRLVQSQNQFPEVREMRESDRRRFFHEPHFREHLELYRVHSADLGSGLDVYRYCRRQYKRYTLETPPKLPLIKGTDLMNAGYRPGPIFKKILKIVEDLQLEGVLKTRRQAIAYVLKTFPLKQEKPTTGSEAG